MERNIDLNQVSDGKLYGLEDMVRADCAGCAGCSACCRGMGSSVVLDPLDAHRLMEGTGRSFEDLLRQKLELHVVDGSVMLPNLNMTGEGEACLFLDENGRCSVHAYRPGICRLFPLGRLYEDGSFRYFLQVHECKKESRAKIKVKKWIDIPDGKAYDQYICDWHYFLKRVEKKVKESQDTTTAWNVSMYLLKEFYMTPYEKDQDFYGQLRSRIKRAEELLGTGK